MVGVLRAVHHVQSVQPCLCSITGKPRVHIRAAERRATGIRERVVHRVPALLHLDGPNVKRIDALPLNLIVIHAGAVPNFDLGDGVREITGVADTRIALDDRDLRERFSNDQQPAIHRRASRLCVVDVHDVNRDVHHLAFWHVDHDAVGDERRIHRRKAGVLICGELPHPFGDKLRSLFDRVGQRGHGHIDRQFVKCRERALEAAVHKYQSMPLRIADDECADIRWRKLQRSGLHGLEFALGDRRNAGKVPVLIARRRKAQCGETIEGAAAKIAQPAAHRRCGGERVRVRHGHAASITQS